MKPELQQDHRNCRACECELLPLGRAVLTMVDGGVVEVVLRTCGTCHAVSMEQAATSSLDVPDLDHDEEERR